MSSRRNCWMSVNNNHKLTTLPHVMCATVERSRLLTLRYAVWMSAFCAQWAALHYPNGAFFLLQESRYWRVKADPKKVKHPTAAQLWQLNLCIPPSFILSCNIRTHRHRPQPVAYCIVLVVL